MTVGAITSAGNQRREPAAPAGVRVLGDAGGENGDLV